MLNERQGQHPIFSTAGTLTKLQKTFPVIHNRSSNAHIHRAPHRRLQNDSPTALGVSTRIPLLVEKPIVRSPRPSEFNECLRADTAAVVCTLDRSKYVQPQTKPLTERLPRIVCDDQVQALSEKRLYTSTTREATEEAALPTPRRAVPRTTLEREADPVRCRAVRYSPRPSVWQQYAREWDAMQLRRFSDADRVDSDMTLMSRNLPKTDYMTREFAFLHPMPGYGGFVPRHAVEPRSHTDTDCTTDCMCSTAGRTYRNYPASEYKVLEHAHKGPFSKTVTMTHPLNPFNKVEHQAHSY